MGDSRQWQTYTYYTAVLYNSVLSKNNKKSGLVGIRSRDPPAIRSSRTVEDSRHIQLSCTVLSQNSNKKSELVGNRSRDLPQSDLYYKETSHVRAKKLVDELCHRVQIICKIVVLNLLFLCKKEKLTSRNSPGEKNASV
jgi:hypothetical protein